MAVVAALLLARQVTVGTLDLTRITRKEQRRLYLCAVRGSEVCFQAEVKACGFTRLGNVQLDTFCQSNNTQPQITYAVTLDCDRLDTVCIEVSAFVVSEDSLAYTHLVAIKEFVSSLFECIGQVPKARPKCGRSLVVFGKELLIAKVYALDHIL